MHCRGSKKTGTHGLRLHTRLITPERWLLAEDLRTPRIPQKKTRDTKEHPRFVMLMFCDSYRALAHHDGVDLPLETFAARRGFH